jgi:hypothetical protein
MLRQILRNPWFKRILLPFCIECFICKNISDSSCLSVFKLITKVKSLIFKFFQNRQNCPWKCAKYWQWVICCWKPGRYKRLMSENDLKIDFIGPQVKIDKLWFYSIHFEILTSWAKQSISWAISDMGNLQGFHLVLLKEIFFREGVTIASRKNSWCLFFN